MQKNLVITCLLNFFIAATLGLLLRYAFVGNLGFNYRFLTHAHSHIAMLGWVYLMLYTCIVHYFVPNGQNKTFYNRLFWITQIAVIGMLFSFPFQGYAAISITFSTLHILCSYVFVFKLWKDMRIDNPFVKQMVKWALSFMVLTEASSRPRPSQIKPLLSLSNCQCEYVVISYTLSINAAPP